jgi:hypothetical protein
VATLIVAPAAVAQDAAGPTCALVSAAEVSSIVGAQLALNPNSSAYYCSLGEGSALTISLLPETELEPMKADFSGGGEDLTVAGNSAWWQESSGNFLVAANGSVLFLNGWSIAETAEDKLTALTALAELIVPRVPPPAYPITVARLTGLIPSTIGGEALEISVVPGWYLLGQGEAVRPEAQAVLDLLAQQGRSSDELVVVAGTTSSGAGALVAAVPDVDASTLVGPLLGVLLPGVAAAPTSSVELGGKQVTRVESEPVIHTYASGDVVALANGTDDFLASFFDPLP